VSIEGKCLNGPPGRSANRADEVRQNMIRIRTLHRLGQDSYPGVTFGQRKRRILTLGVGRRAPHHQCGFWDFRIGTDLRNRSLQRFLILDEEQEYVADGRACHTGALVQRDCWLLWESVLSRPKGICGLKLIGMTEFSECIPRVFAHCLNAKLCDCFFQGMSQDL
jgi:hypothetical protein